MCTRNRRFLSLLPALILAACNGTDRECGPGEAAGTLVGSSSSDAVEWSDVRASPNNDCSTADGPVSLTLEATQTGGDKLVVLCLPRPDQLNGEVTLPDDTAAQVIAVIADAGDCLLSLDRGRAISGTVSFSGVCDDGVHDAGFAMDMDATFPVIVACPGEADAEDEIGVSGVVSVRADVP